jgi:hypothetical protein
LRSEIHFPRSLSPPATTAGSVSNLTRDYLPVTANDDVAISTRVNKPENDDSTLLDRTGDPFDVWAHLNGEAQ